MALDHSSTGVVRFPAEQRQADILSELKAIHALLAEPLAAKIERVRIAPGDMVVIHSEEPVSAALEERIRENLRIVLPGTEVIIVHGGLSVQILTKEDAPE